MRPTFSTDGLPRSSQRAAVPRHTPASTQRRRRRRQTTSPWWTAIFLVVAAGLAAYGLRPHYTRLHQAGMHQSLVVQVESYAARSELSLASLPNIDEPPFRNVRRSTRQVQLLLAQKTSARLAGSRHVRALHAGYLDTLQAPEHPAADAALYPQCVLLEQEVQLELAASQELLAVIRASRSDYVQANQIILQSESELSSRGRLAIAVLMWDYASVSLIGRPASRSWRLRRWREPVASALDDFDAAHNATSRVVEDVSQKHDRVQSLCAKLRDPAPPHQIAALRHDLELIRAQSTDAYSGPGLTE